MAYTYSAINVVTDDRCEGDSEKVGEFLGCNGAILEGLFADVSEKRGYKVNRIIFHGMYRVSREYYQTDEDYITKDFTEYFIREWNRTVAPFRILAYWRDKRLGVR